MKTQVTFRSDKFPAYENEEHEINPGRYGKRVAEFLSVGLRSHGLEPQQMLAEDWGWVVPIKNEEFKLWIGCGNYEEYSDGFLCFIESHTSEIRKIFRKVETKAQVDARRKAMDTVLSESAGIRETKWWTHDEFNNPLG